MADYDCAICTSAIVELCATPQCGHKFCVNCLEQWQHTEVEIDDFANDELNGPGLEGTNWCPICRSLDTIAYLPVPAPPTPPPAPPTPQPAPLTPPPAPPTPPPAPLTPPPAPPTPPPAPPTPQYHLVCQICGVIFNNSSMKAQHMESQHRPRQPCPRPNCNRAYRNRSSLKRHLRLDHQNT